MTSTLGNRRGFVLLMAVSSRGAYIIYIIQNKERPEIGRWWSAAERVLGPRLLKCAAAAVGVENRSAKVQV
jgi:hypothetical protein